MSDCPNFAKHIEGPRSYVDRFEWRTEMSKTHKVSRCPDCLRYVIWTPKNDQPDAAPAQENNGR
jgi:hypothetical protein